MIEQTGQDQRRAAEEQGHPEMGHRRQEEVEDPLIPRNPPEQPQRGPERREPHQQGPEDQIVELREAASPPEPEAEEKRAVENIEQLDPDRVPPLLEREG